MSTRGNWRANISTKPKDPEKMQMPRMLKLILIWRFVFKLGHLELCLILMAAKHRGSARQHLPASLKCPEGSKSPSLPLFPLPAVTQSLLHLLSQQRTIHLYFRLFSHWFSKTHHLHAGSSKCRDVLPPYMTQCREQMLLKTNSEEEKQLFFTQESQKSNYFSLFLPLL